MGIADATRDQELIKSDDGLFEKLDGRAVFQLLDITKEPNKFNEEETQYNFKWGVKERIEGNCQPGRQLTLRYSLGHTPSLNKLTQELFTADIPFDKSSDEAFEAGFDGMKMKTAVIRCYAYEVDGQKRQGRAFQQNKVLDKVKTATTGSAPF